MTAPSPEPLITSDQESRDRSDIWILPYHTRIEIRSSLTSVKTFFKSTNKYKYFLFILTVGRIVIFKGSIRIRVTKHLLTALTWSNKDQTLMFR